MVHGGAVVVTDGRTASNPEAAFLQRELGDRLADALRALAERQPENALLLKERYLQEVEPEVLAQEWHLSREAVQRRITAGVTFIRNYLREYLR